MNDATAAVTLVAEDEAIVSMVLEWVLKMHGFEVCGVASSEQEALEIAARSHPTHAVCDVQLAPGDGRRLANELARRYHSAIVFCTAYGEQVKCDSDLPPGLLIHKPYNPEDVILALHAARQIADGEEPEHLPPGAIRCGRGSF